MNSRLLLNNLIAMPVIIVLMSSCSNYYKAISKPLESNVEKAATIDSLQKAKRILILRTGTDAFLMITPAVTGNEVDCTLDTLPERHKLHLTKGRKGKMKYFTKKNEENGLGDKEVLNEAHVYIDPGIDIKTGQFSIPLANIRQIEIIEKDKGRTTKSYLLGVVISVGVVAIVVSIIAASQLSNMTFSGLGI